MTKNKLHTAEGKLTPDDMLSGSQVCAVLGKNPYSTPNDVLKRAFNAVNGIENEFNPIENAHWGSTFEVPILNHSAQKLGLGNPKTAFGRAFFHKDIPLAVSLDGMLKGDGREVKTDPSQNIYVMNADSIVLEGDGILESKLTGHEAEIDLPDYRGPIQLQAQMDTVQSDTGKPVRWGAVCVLYKGVQLRIFLYKRDEILIRQIHDAAIDFDKRVNKYRENDETEWYPIQTTKEASEMFEDVTEETIDLNDEFADKAERIIEIEQDIKSLTQELETYQAQIMANMRDYKYANAGQYHIAWGSMNYKAVPEKVIPAKPARTVRVKKLRITKVK